jgi:hypothetical protein
MSALSIQQANRPQREWVWLFRKKKLLIGFKH